MAVGAYSTSYWTRQFEFENWNGIILLGILNRYCLYCSIFIDNRQKVLPEEKKLYTNTRDNGTRYGGTVLNGFTRCCSRIRHWQEGDCRVGRPWDSLERQQDTRLRYSRGWIQGIYVCYSYRVPTWWTRLGPVPSEQSNAFRQHHRAKRMRSAHQEPVQENGNNWQFLPTADGQSEHSYVVNPTLHKYCLVQSVPSLRGFYFFLFSKWTLVEFIRFEAIDRWNTLQIENTMNTLVENKARAGFSCSTIFDFTNSSFLGKN